MSALRVALSNAQTQGEAIVQLGMGQVEIARAIQAVKQCLVGRVSVPVAETH